MKLSTSKKILFLGIILLIIAGIVVIALKGLNVSLLYRQHEAINLSFNKKVDSKDLRAICKEVFGNKKVVIRKVELFNDSVNINVDSITDEEKELLANKINEKYELSDDNKYTTENIKVATIPNIRLRDIILPYIKPTAISSAIIFVYMLVIYRKQQTLKKVLRLLKNIIITELLLLSLIAVTRLPVSATTINLILIIGLVELLLYNCRLEKQ